MILGSLCVCVPEYEKQLHTQETIDSFKPDIPEAWGCYFCFFPWTQTPIQSSLT